MCVTLVRMWVDILRKIDLLAGLSDRQIESLAASGRRKRLAAGAVVVSEGDPGHSLYLVLSGSVGIRKTDEFGNSVQVAERHADSFFGEMSLLDGGPRAADVVTLEPSEFLIVDRAEFLRLVKADPDVAMKVITTLCARLRESDTLASKRPTVRERLAHRLLDLVGDSGRYRNSARFRLPITRTALAEQVRACRETVSRELAQMERQGLIQRNGREILIPDLSRLSKAANLTAVSAARPPV